MSHVHSISDPRGALPGDSPGDLYTLHMLLFWTFSLSETVAASVVNYRCSPQGNDPPIHSSRAKGIHPVAKIAIQMSQKSQKGCFPLQLLRSKYFSGSVHVSAIRFMGGSVH